MVVDDDSAFTHYLGLKGGIVLKKDTNLDGRNEDEWIKIRVTQHTDKDENPKPSVLNHGSKQWKNRTSTMHVFTRLYSKAVTAILEHTNTRRRIFPPEHQSWHIHARSQ